MTTPTIKTEEELREEFIKWHKAQPHHSRRFKTGQYRSELVVKDADPHAITDYWLSQMASYKEALGGEVENTSTPSLMNYELTCSNCGEDMGLEAYNCFSDGYEEAVKDIISLINNSTTR